MGSSRELRAACRDTEREKGVTAGAPKLRTTARPAFRARPLSFTSSRRPERGFPSGLHLLLLALPPPLPEKAPRKPPHFPSRLRRRSSGRPFGRARPLKGEWPARPTSRAPRAWGGATAARLARGGASRSPLAWGWPRAHLSLCGALPRFRRRRSEAGGRPTGDGLGRASGSTPSPAFPRLPPGRPERGPARSPQPSSARVSLFPPSPPDFLQFPGRHVGGLCSVESAKVARTFTTCGVCS